MKRSVREELGITLTLPLSMERRQRARRELLLRRAAIVALLLLGAAVAAIGLYRPARAALARADSVGQCVAQNAGIDEHREL